MNYFVKTFEIEDGDVFTYDKRDLIEYLPYGWEIRGGAQPIITFGPETVTVAIEVFKR